MPRTRRRHLPVDRYGGHERADRTELEVRFPQEASRRDRSARFGEARQPRQPCGAAGQRHWHAGRSSDPRRFAAAHLLVLQYRIIRRSKSNGSSFRGHPDCNDGRHVCRPSLSRHCRGARANALGRMRTRSSDVAGTLSDHATQAGRLSLIRRVAPHSGHPSTRSASSSGPPTIVRTRVTIPDSRSDSWEVDPTARPARPESFLSQPCQGGGAASFRKRLVRHRARQRQPRDSCMDRPRPSGAWIARRCGRRSSRAFWWRRFSGCHGAFINSAGGRSPYRTRRK